MKQKELEMLIQTGFVQELTTQRLYVGNKKFWGLYVESERMLPHGWYTFLETARGDMRLFASLDSIYNMLKGMNWEGKLQVRIQEGFNRVRDSMIVDD